MSDYGYSLQITLSSDATVIHYSEHYDARDVTATLEALGYPANALTFIGSAKTDHFYSIQGYDHLSVKIGMVNRKPEPHYDFVVTVRITGKRNGWQRTILDTPKFCLISHAAGGSIYTYAGARRTVQEMFGALMQEGDTMHVNIHPINVTIEGK